MIFLEIVPAKKRRTIRKERIVSDLQKVINALMREATLKKEYEALQPERNITKPLICVRKEAGRTQAALSKKTEHEI